MKVFHNKAFKLEEEISSQLGLECYVPREKVVVENCDGKRICKIRPAVAGLLFLKTSAEVLKSVKALTNGVAMFYPAPDGTPAVIPEKEMTMFWIPVGSPTWMILFTICLCSRIFLRLT